MRTSIFRTAVIGITLAMVLQSCAYMNNTEKGYVAGSVGGTIIGASLGAAVGGRQGADIGAHLGMAVGGVTGAAAGAAADAEEAQANQTKRTVTKTTTTTTPSDTYYDESTGRTYRKISTDGSMLFSSRSSELTDYTRDEAEHIYDQLGGMEWSEIVVYGATDDSESRDYSYELSCERANAVADYLVELGVPSDKITVVGLGDECPIDDNDTATGRANNRCVEVYIVQK